jgi:hypothetical protein
MKKLLTSLLVLFLTVPVFSQTSSPPPRTFQIHSEKRPFIKKGDRKRWKARHHHRMRKMADKRHFQEKHKK